MIPISTNTGLDSCFEDLRGVDQWPSKHERWNYVRERGYPVPAIHDVLSDGTELVMERIDGPSMLTVLARRPWTISNHGAMLAHLHQALHRIPAPDWIKDAPCGHRNQLLHLDLHPDNVMMGTRGPVVIDWSNASRGDENSDVALTWVLLAAAGIPTGRVRSALLGLGRAFLVSSFLRNFDVDKVKDQLPAVVEWKLTDPHMDLTERAAMRKLILRAK